MSGRVHDRSHFYKHTTREAAAEIIKARGFRWSTPTAFNDPFDHQIGFVLHTEVPVLSDMLAVALEKQIYSETMPVGHPNSPLQALVRQTRSIRDRVPREVMIQNIRQACSEMAMELPKRLADFNAQIQRHLCHARVLCVTESLNNVVLWSHYAEGHRGVAFKLRCDDALDNLLLAARQINYSEEFIRFPDEEAFVRSLLGEKEIDYPSLIWQIVYTKHVDWAYEREWRVHRPLLDQPAGDGYTTIQEDPSIFEAIYLGCRMPREDAEAIIALVRVHLPNARTFQAVRSDRSFALAFNEVNES